MSGKTCWEAVQEQFGSASGYGGYVGDAAKPRVFVHDLLHIITRESSRNALGEQKQAIFQSVLTRDCQVSRRVNYSCPAQEKGLPRYRDVSEETRMGMVDFLKAYHRQQNWSGKFPVLQDCEAKETYWLAKCLDRAIYQTIGHYFYQIPLEALVDMPISLFEEAMQNAENMFMCMKPYGLGCQGPGKNGGITIA